MVIWIAGNSRSGKTTLAREMQRRMPGSIVLDGDAMRKAVGRDLDMSEAGRTESNMRVARLAAEIAAQGVPVIVSTICPYRSLRDKVQEITGCHFIILKGGIESSPEYPFEY